MAADDTVRNRAQQVRGKGKEVTGAAIGDKSLERGGKKDMASGEVKQRTSKVKDAFS